MAIAAVDIAGWDLKAHLLQLLRLRCWEKSAKAFLLTPAAASLPTPFRSSLLNTAILRGTLTELARWQGTKIDDWRDAQPGRLIHESHTDPLSALNQIPRGRYYGATTDLTGLI
jgi:hypothetical protein